MSKEFIPKRNNGCSICGKKPSHFGVNIYYWIFEALCDSCESIILTGDYEKIVKLMRNKK